MKSSYSFIQVGVETNLAFIISSFDFMGCPDWLHPKDDWDRNLWNQKVVAVFFGWKTNLFFGGKNLLFEDGTLLAGLREKVCLRVRGNESRGEQNRTSNSLNVHGMEENPHMGVGVGPFVCVLPERRGLSPTYRQPLEPRIVIVSWLFNTASGVWIHEKNCWLWIHFDSWVSQIKIWMCVLKKDQKKICELEKNKNKGVVRRYKSQTYSVHFEPITCLLYFKYKKNTSFWMRTFITDKMANGSLATS